MSKSSEKVKAWRRRTKEKLVVGFGGKCGICQYDRCYAALDFHHLDPAEKDFGFAARGNSRSWAKIVEEAKKCVMMCSNCHSEYHAGLIEIPKDIPRFNVVLSSNWQGLRPISA